MTGAGAELAPVLGVRDRGAPRRRRRVACRVAARRNDAVRPDSGWLTSDARPDVTKIVAGSQQVELARGALDLVAHHVGAAELLLPPMRSAPTCMIDGSAATASNTARALPSRRWRDRVDSEHPPVLVLGGPASPRRRSRRDRRLAASRPCRPAQCGWRSCGAGSTPARRAAGCAPSSSTSASGTSASTRSFQRRRSGRGEGVLVEELALEQRESVAHQVERRRPVDGVVGQDAVDERRPGGSRRGSGSGEKPDLVLQDDRGLVGLRGDRVEPPTELRVRDHAPTGTRRSRTRRG